MVTISPAILAAKRVQRSVHCSLPARVSSGT